MLTFSLDVLIHSFCTKHRVPINVLDAPHLCTFTLLSTHTDGALQIGVTTNGSGCKLASRIRREITSSLPQNLGAACERMGTIRQRLMDQDRKAHQDKLDALDPLDEDGSDGGSDESLDQDAAFNKLVLENEANKNRRMRWLSQICEYWPLKRLAAITDSDVEEVMASYNAEPEKPLEPESLAVKSLEKKGRIILAGSGPGHPDLLTRATHKAILSADVILADKLVPAGVLDLIPRRTPVHIARKFPGNAEKAQEELLSLGLEGLEAGKTVLRLKQGDPYIYGRGGEAFEFFRAKGYGDRIAVLPGITSALSAPLFSQIPATQRAVSDQVLICTGTGRKGKPTAPPTYVKTQTVVFLMALHRIRDLVDDLTTFGPEHTAAVETGEPQHGYRALWPKTTPCAVIERASCPDQRVIRTTLEFVAQAIESEGSRPPGLLVLGKACEVLVKPQEGKEWLVEEGFKGVDGLGDEVGLEGVLEAWETNRKLGAVTDVKQEKLESLKIGFAAVSAS